MKKLVALAIFLSLFGGNLALAQTTSTNDNSVPRGIRRFIQFLRQEPPDRATSVIPRSSSPTGLGQDVSSINREAEEEMRTLRMEMEAKIKAIRAEYEEKIRAIRESARLRIQAIQSDRRGASTTEEEVEERTRNISTSTKRFFLLRWLGRD